MTDRLFLTLIITLGVIFHLWKNYRLENRIDPNDPLDRKDVLLDPLLLPTIISFTLIFLMAEISGRFPQGISQQTVSLLITISLYYSLLILLMLWLRRVFRPKACASFWVLPNVFYISSYARFHLTPIVYLHFPVAYLRLVKIGWLAGFVIILGWQVFQHIRYRRRILSQAASTADEDLIQDWRDSLKRHDISTNIPLKITEAVSSPVTIGLFDRHMVLVLPTVTYTPEDRRLIFAHEARHIMGSDSKKSSWSPFVPLFSLPRS